MKFLSEQSLLILIVATLVSIGALEHSYFVLSEAETMSAMAAVTLAINHPQAKPRYQYQVPDHTLLPGTDGLEVVALQKFLKFADLLGSTTPASGHYGIQTELAVKKFQASHQLEQTGTLGPQTRAALTEDLK